MSLRQNSMRKVRRSNIARDVRQLLEVNGKPMSVKLLSKILNQSENGLSTILEHEGFQVSHVRPPKNATGTTRHWALIHLPEWELGILL
jgi:hypothetical protein